MTYGSIFILGRQPALGRAELESLFGADTLSPIGEHAIACTVPIEEVAFARLGGSVRMAVPLTTLETTTWPAVQRETAAVLARLLETLPSEGKIKLGLSALGTNVRTKQLFAAGLELKKTCKQAKRSVRLVPNTEPELSSAQVLHNQLTGELGIELLIIQSGNQTVLARTVAVQDITAYARRDQGRPKRDARVGMLPPKLAQIIVNLAAGPLPATPTTAVLDPFCGTGVVLQEALLMGYSGYGSDIEPRMVDFTSTNIDWLRSAHPDLDSPLALDTGDAASHDWKPTFHTIASEAYLGRPFSAPPAPDVLAQVVRDVNTIISKFLQNVARQTNPGFRLCVAVPAWRTQNRIMHLPLLDRLEEIGYNRIRFEHASDQELIYYRPEQIVARQLLIITRK